MELTIEKTDVKIIVKVSGKLVIEVNQEFRKELFSLVHENDLDIEFDFSDVPGIDSSCIGTLIMLKKKLDVKKHKLIIGKASASVKEVFKLSKLDDFF